MFFFQDSQQEQQHAGSKLNKISKPLGRYLQNIGTCTNDLKNGKAENSSSSIRETNSDSSGGESSKRRHQVKELKKKVPSAFKDKDNELSDDSSFASDEPVQDCFVFEDTESECCQEQ